MQPVEFGMFSHVSLPEHSTGEGENELWPFTNWVKACGMKGKEIFDRRVTGFDASKEFRKAAAEKHAETLDSISDVGSLRLLTRQQRDFKSQVPYCRPLRRDYAAPDGNTKEVLMSLPFCRFWR